MTRNKLFGLTLAALILPALVAFAPPADAKKRKRKRKAHAARLTGKVNIKTAKVRQLSLLPRIGRSTAKRIVTYRAAKPFQAIRDLMRVKGIGKATFLKAKKHLSVRGPNTLRRVKLKKSKRSAKRKKASAKKRRKRCRR